MGEIKWNGKQYDCDDARVSKVNYGIGGKLGSKEKYYFVRLKFKKGKDQTFTSPIENEKDVHRACKDAISQAEQYLKSLV